MMKSTMRHNRLTIAALAVAALATWAGRARAADTIINTTDTRTGDVSIGAGSGDNLYIGYNGGTGTLDVSGTTSFTANVARLYVGASGTSNSKGTLKLGGLNDITAATSVIIGGDPGGNAISNTGTLTTTASGTTTIKTPSLIIGETKTNTGSFTLGSSAGLTLEGLSGGRAQLILGYYHNSDGVARNPTGTMTLTAGSAGMKLSRLMLGWKTSASSASGTPNGTLTFGAGGANHLDISGSGTVVQIGLNQSTSGGATGTLTLAGLDSTSVIESTDNSTAILLGSKSTAGAASGTLNLNGGTLKITTAGAAIAGGGGTTRALNLASAGAVKLIAGASSTDWIHSLSAAVINSNGVTIDTDGKNIGVSQAFTGTGGLIKDGAGKLTLSGTQGYTGATEIKAGELSLSGSLHASSAVSVVSGATLSGSGTINGSLSFAAGAKLALNLDTSFDPTAALKVNGAVSFAGFGLGDVFGLDDLTPMGTYRLIGGTGTINTANISNYGSDNPGSIGGGKSAYFDTGSLNLVVIPEPATMGLLGVIGLAMLLRRRIHG